MNLHSFLTVQEDTKQICFGSYEVPVRIEKEVTSILQQTSEHSPPPTLEMLRSAERIAKLYPSFMCAQYAFASVVLCGQGEKNMATIALSRMWAYGCSLLVKEKVVDVHYSASQGNACFLNAGARLAAIKILKEGLPSALSVVNRVLRWDVDNGSDAISVKAHIEQLMGDNNAMASLVKATRSDPKAFYALGLEYLRRQKGKDAAVCFQIGLRHAPEIAEILLGRELIKSDERKNAAFAQQYVETYSLTEWTSSELDVLVKVVDKTIDSTW